MKSKRETSREAIHIVGARQNNLKDLSLSLPLGKLTVVTGVSGSGKSSLAFDTVYSEGQRRYFETFSAYTRQFLDRMDRPRVERIEGIPPAIAIDQTNPVRTSRSTVGTMTELNDHLKLLFAKAARLYCRSCKEEVRRDSPDSVWDRLSASQELHRHGRILITFTVPIPHNFSEEEIIEALTAQGYVNYYYRNGDAVEVIQDRSRFDTGRRGRIIEGLEAAFHHGGGKLTIRVFDKDGTERETLHFSRDLHCPRCDIHYRDPSPNLFSFNSPMGACPSCRGFGRIMGIDYDLVVPDKTKSLREGAVRPFQTKTYRETQRELIDFAGRRGISVDSPWKELSDSEHRWIIEGEGKWVEGRWYGLERFFRWLESKSYKMHIRVLLSRYRAYRVCPDCGGARLVPEALLWRIAGAKEAGEHPRKKQNSPDLPNEDLPGRNLREIMTMPLDRCRRFFDALRLPAPADEVSTVILEEIRSRLRYLDEVGLGYLELDRQSRTLSGGEVQRINLTTALGTSLVNTLFVLDEPSIGLHSRDIGRLIGILHRLRDAGNTLLVVEHDPELIRAADFVLDMGPRAGEAGGEIVFHGTPEKLAASGGSLTAAYMRGEKRVDGGQEVRFPRDLQRGRRSRGPSHPGSILIRGAAANNLKHIDVEIPLGRLVCVTGVSGSGKSTLVQEVCYYGLRKLLGRPVEQPGAHEAILGCENIDTVVLVDQSPIGKTTRSNPASYVGAFDAIRKLFAGEPLAAARDYGPGHFSFNSPKGKCPTCGGSGFEHVEMQFLSDVYLRCPDCNGSRYRAEVLEIRMESSNPEDTGLNGAKNVAEVLELTVDEALDFFGGNPEVMLALAPLIDVGLGYVRLGQALPTLSGGEAQRLKLAGYLAESRKRRKNAAGPGLFLFDEPTTGLHFDDIAVLLQALRSLIEAGHSVLVIEHNLDVIAAADHLIDLGPEGGEQGGRIVFTGSPAELIEGGSGHSAEALRRSRSSESYGGAAAETPQTYSAGSVTRDKRLEAGEKTKEILIRGAREHNLQNIDLQLPRESFTVITGVSGSGKSTVAFDILFAEGQRRYLESLNAYARQFVQPASRPEVDGVSGLPPTVAIEQRSSRGGWKSTVATVTEIHHFLRLLFVRLGLQYCPDCGIPIRPQTREQIISSILKDYRGSSVEIAAPLIHGRKGIYRDLAAWAGKKGYAHLRVDGELLPTDTWPKLDRYREHDILLPVGEIEAVPTKEDEIKGLIDEALRLGGDTVTVLALGGAERESTRVPRLYSTVRSCPRCSRSFEELDPRLFSYNSPHGWCPVCRGTGRLSDEENEKNEANGEGGSAPADGASDSEDNLCPACGGTRLRPEARAVRFDERPVADYGAMTVSQAAAFFSSYSPAGREAAIARDVIGELRSRLSFLEEVGLSYLTLDRAAPTLSGGEAQRIRLAGQLGSELRGVCYILDEPTIGLHHRDNRMLLKTLKGLKEKGNTVVVVEHDEEMIRSAERIIDLGPGGGIEGGRLVFSGTLPDLLKNEQSATGRFLREPLRHPIISPGLDAGGAAPGGSAENKEKARLVVRGVFRHNLKNIDVEIPLSKLICVTGVSGSGKSSLAREVLYRNLRRLLSSAKPKKKGNAKSGSKRGRPQEELSGCRAIEGWEQISRTLEVDQSPIGKTPRSCPATYVGFWNAVRSLFAETPEAKLRGYDAGRFSFNVAGGRCDDCGGQGIKRIEMSFLPDVRIPCETCGGARFNRETLEVEYKGKNIAEVLEMNISEAADFFRPVPAVFRPLALLEEVGLDYLSLGRQSPTLSGGEAQRLKLVTELSKARRSGEEVTFTAKPTLYILDEPTVGLHMADVEKLLRVLRRLTETGNTVVVIEHNLDVVAEADHIIDLGPEGGEGGGKLVAAGSPDSLAAHPGKSHTARALAEFLSRRNGTV
jgi:excinuclease ABC subunit A